MSYHRNWKRVLLDEFRVSNFLLTHDKPEVFAEPQVGGTWLIYVIYRVILALYTIAVLIYGGLQAGANWLPTFTLWSYFMLTSSLTLQAATVILHAARRTTQDASNAYENMPCHMKITWLVTFIAYASPFVVVPIFWSLLYSPGIPVTFLDANVHAANIVIVFIDFFISGLPIRLLHFWYGTLYSLIYIIFTVIWWKIKGGYIYFFLNWSDPGLAIGISAIFAFVAVPVLTIVMWLLFQARISLYSLCSNEHRRSASTEQLGENDDHLII